MPTYLVTGASRGLGYALVQFLAADTANTVVGLARDKVATEHRLKTDGIHNVHVVSADIAIQDQVQHAAEETKKIVGGKGIDVMINNAGYVSETTALPALQEFERDVQSLLDDAQKSFNINVLGTVQTVFAFLPLVQQSQLKKVISISSGQADIDFINESRMSNAGPYGSSKAALNIFFSKFQAAYADEGLLFLSLCPGWVNTAESEVKISDQDSKRFAAVMERFNKYSPGAAPAEPLEAARRIMVAIERSSLVGGHGGSFVSHNGTTRWM